MTPTFNRAALLEQTLRSVRAQTYPLVEHIVVDGGSADGTVELLRQFEGTYRLRWVSGADDGMYEAINRGLSLAEGEVVAYLNSDDLYFPWTIATAVEALAHHPEAAFVYGDALSVDDETGRTRFLWQAPFDLDFVQRVDYLVQPTVFWRRSVMRTLGPFDEGLRFVADCDFWMRAGSKYRFVKVNEFLAIERSHRSTFRETEESGLLAEIDMVRRRYVSLTGLEHRGRSTWGTLRMAGYRRCYWLRFAIASIVPATLRGQSWSRLLLDRRLRFSRPRSILVQFLPFRTAARSDQLVMPNRSWLEPPP